VRSEERAELEVQRRALEAACERHGWQLLEAAAEAGRLAQDLHRTGGAQARRRVLERAELLLAGKRERPAQALLELASLLVSAQQQGFALLALDCALETTTSGGELSANLLASFTPCERRLISKRTRAALARKRAEGVRLGRPPTMAPYALDRIRRERAAGKSLAAIANGLNADRIPTAQGGRRWYPATIRYTLDRAN
jgi:DNA invertase Pin-like site-specific DNA recombinase